MTTLVRADLVFRGRLASVSGTRASDLAGRDGGGEAGFRVGRPGGSRRGRGGEGRADRSPRAAPARDCRCFGDSRGRDAARVIHGEVCAICRDDVTRRGRIDACDHLSVSRASSDGPKSRPSARCARRASRSSNPRIWSLRIRSRGPPRAAPGRAAHKRSSSAYTSRTGTRYTRATANYPTGWTSRRSCAGGAATAATRTSSCSATVRPGFHCYRAGLDSVPMGEWRCAICAVEDEDDEDGNVTTDHPERRRESASGEDESTRRDEAMARLQRAEDAAARASAARRARRRREGTGGDAS